MTKDKFLSLNIECEDKYNILSVFKRLLKKAQDYYRDGNSGEFVLRELYDEDNGDAEIQAWERKEGNIVLNLFIDAPDGGSDFCFARFSDDNDCWEDDDELQNRFEENFAFRLFNA